MAYHIPEDYARVIEWSRASGTIVIGWGGVGDLVAKSPRDAVQLTKIVEKTHRQWTGPSNWVNGGRSLWRLYHDMQVGDLVIVNSNRRELVMRVLGDYYYASDSFPPDYYHRRKAEATSINPEWLWRRSGGPAAGEGVRWTLFRCANIIGEAEVLTAIEG